MTITEADFQYVRSLVRLRASIVLAPGKEYLVEARLRPVADDHGLASVGELVERLRSEAHNGLHHRVVEAMTTNETSFFRDQSVFEALRDHVLPALLRGERRGRPLTIWSAACSSGQEAYSLLMLLAEHFAAALPATTVVASDISPEMLERARTARYSRIEIGRGLPTRLLVRYFDRDGAGWRVRDELRRRVVLRELNLAGPWPALPTADLVLCRNVLIYFDVETKRTVLERLQRQLASGGYLVLGASETVRGITEDYETHRVGGAAFYRSQQ